MTMLRWPARAPLLLLLVTGATACSSEPSNGAGGASGTAATSGGSAGANMGGVSTGGAAAGSSASAGAGSGTAGMSNIAGAGAGGSSAGSSLGGAAGAAGAGGSGGSSGSSGSGGSGGSGPTKQFTCPAGPFPQQTMGASTDICTNFTYNYNFNEGPTWIASQNAFFFTNFIVGRSQGGDIIKYTPGGQCEVWVHEVGCNGLGVSATGNILAACHGPRAVMEYDVKTKQGRMVATMANGKMLDSPNDLIARSDGNIYFSNRTAELDNRPVGLGESLVRIDPLGAISVIQTGPLNGVALSPDETKLHVVAMGTWTLDAAGLPGQKGSPTPSGDGIAVDCAGNITNNGTNSAFGGPDGKTLLIVGGGTKARTVRMTVPGLP
jgi:gluconolactonase